MLRRIEGSKARFWDQTFTKKSRQAENISNHTLNQKGIVCDCMYTFDSFFTSVSTASRSLVELGCSIVWLLPASVMRPHCSRLCTPLVHNWWACALQSNQHSWSVTELQTYIYIYTEVEISARMCDYSCLVLMHSAIISVQKEEWAQSYEEDVHISIIWQSVGI